MGLRLVKKLTNFFFKTGLPEVQGGKNWRHCGVFSICLDRSKA